MKITSIISLIAAILSALIVLSLSYGLITGAFENGAGMAILVFMLYGAIFSLVAVFFGIIAYILARRKATPIPRYGKFGFGIGILSALSLIVLINWG